jgi:hypothetical protein
MTQSQSLNFGWLADQVIFGDARGSASQAIRRFGEAEQIARFSPTAACMLCRAGLEIVVEAHWEQFRKRHGLQPPEQKTLGSLIFVIQRHLECTREEKAWFLWDQFAQLNQKLNRYVHNKTEATFDRAVARLDDSHRLLFALLGSSSRPPFEMPAVLRPTAQDLEHERSLQADPSERERLASQLEQSRREAEELKRQQNEVQAELNALRDELDGVRDRNNSLLKDLQAKGDLSQYQQMIEDSAERIRHLERVSRILDDAARQADERRKEAEATAESLQRNIEELRDSIAEESAGRARSDLRIRRLRRYTDDYPGIEGAAEFLAESLQGDEEGLLPPFDTLVELQPLAADPYALRFEAVHPEGRCTLRVMAANGPFGAEACLRAWACERRNIQEMPELRERTGLARVILAPDPDQPGFVAFSRPSAPTLWDFGGGGRRLRLAQAFRFSLSLIDELAARERRSMVTTWPDLGTVAVMPGNRALLLEPTATHFGDLGPECMRDLDVETARTMDEHRTEQGWSYVLSHVFLRVSGLIAAGPGPTSLQECLDPRELREWLEEARRASEERINPRGIPRIAETIPACLDPDVRPLPDELAGLFRAALEED